MTSSSRKILTVNLSFDQVMPALERALGNIGANISESDRTNGRIKAKIGTSVWSWGENIIIIVTRSQSGYSVDVESKSALSTTVADWGKNETNIQKLARELSLIEDKLLSTSRGNMPSKAFHNLECPNCGGQLELSPDGLSSKCQYCRRKLVA